MGWAFEAPIQGRSKGSRWLNAETSEYRVIKDVFGVSARSDCDMGRGRKLANLVLILVSLAWIKISML